MATTPTPVTGNQATLADWKRRMKWRMMGYRVDLVVPGKKAPPRHVDVLAPFLDDIEVGVGAAPDEVIRKAAPSTFSRLNGSRKTGKDELVDFLEAMGSAIDAGASEADALALAASSCQSPRMRGTVSALFAMVSNGLAMGEAMSLFPDTFSPMIVALTRAAERGNEKGKVLVELAERMRSDNNLMRKFYGALAYPTVVLIGAIVVSLILQIKALPPMVETFKEMGATLPYVTQVFFDASTFMRRNWLILVPSVLVALFLFVKNVGKMYRTRLSQRVVLHMPYFGEVVRGLCMSRALYVHCMLKSNGAGDEEVYRLSGYAAANLGHKEFFDAVYKRIIGRTSGVDVYLPERHRISQVA